MRWVRTRRRLLLLGRLDSNTSPLPIPSVEPVLRQNEQVEGNMFWSSWWADLIGGMPLTRPQASNPPHL